MKILLIDGYNVLHIARSGFSMGEYAIVYNFFRALKAHVETHTPDRVVIALEGEPKKRLAAFPGYKANRTVDSTDTAKVRAQDCFLRQKKIILGGLVEMFPVSLVKHPDFEADDTIFNLICNASSITQWTVLSTDTDFLQLFQGEAAGKNVKLYNPVRKKFLSSPGYDYILWKALRGDGSDNIPGVKGVGDKKAEQIVKQGLENAGFSEQDQKQVALNKQLLQFERWTDEETKLMESSDITVFQEEKVKNFFDSMQFASIVKEPYWSSFVKIFSKLSGGLS